jgi:hypothetical protein
LARAYPSPAAICSKRSASEIIQSQNDLGTSRCLGRFNYSTLEKHHYHHPRPTIDQTITLEELAPLHLRVTKEASTAKDDVSPVKHHKRKVLARQRNNYERPGYGNALGYAEDRNGPKDLFSVM